MLIVMRRAGEEIDITLEDKRMITVCVVSLDRNRVRIGIEAPMTIIIDRREITKKKQQEMAGNVA